MKSPTSSLVLRFAFAAACLGGSVGAQAGNTEPYLLPTQMLFPDTLVGQQSAPIALQLINPPGANVAYTFISAGISGADATQFVIVDNQCTGQVLDPGESCQMLIQFSPPDVGSKAALITVAYTGPVAGVPPVRLQENLNGKGIVLPATVSSLPALGPFGLALAGFGLLLVAGFAGRRLLR